LLAQLAKSCPIGSTECSLLGSNLLGNSLLNTGRTLSDLADSEGTTLAVDHNSEAVVVGEAGAFSTNGELLSLGGGFPLLVEVEGFNGLKDGASAGAAEDGESEFSESEATEGVHHAGEVGSINEDLLLVDNVNNDAKLSEIFSKVNEGDSAGFNKSSVYLKFN
jgi:hypothetical protein